jgi:hypothetical protein
MSLIQVHAGEHGELNKLPSAGRVILSAVIEGTSGDASREKLRRLFYSPIGVYVSQALRETDCLMLEMDVAAVDLDFTVRTLHTLLPDAVIHSIRLRTFNRNKH